MNCEKVTSKKRFDNINWAKYRKRSIKYYSKQSAETLFGNRQWLESEISKCDEILYIAGLRDDIEFKTRCNRKKIEIQIEVITELLTK